MWWLLEASVRQRLEQAELSGVTPTAEQQAQFEAIHRGYSADSSRILVTVGKTAEISISGVLTKTPSFLAMLFGGGNTTYTEITAALAEADVNPDVEEIILAIDSPGGSIDGLFDTLAAIEAVDTPITAQVPNLAASAAFAIASQADRVVAGNRAARFGSVGIVATFAVDTDTVSVTSTDAPKKVPDITTEEGKAIVREELDALHELFVESIAAGRKTDIETVNANFGQGATLLAGEALKRGMIDAIADAKLSVVGATTSTKTALSGGDNSETGPMNLNELKAQHPDVYQAAVSEGVSQERDRVNAHLTMGSASGDMKTAVAAIESGDGMTATLQATYMAAGMNRRDIEARDEDEAGADTGDVGQGGEADAETDKKIGANILAAAAEQCGVELGA